MKNSYFLIIISVLTLSVLSSCNNKPSKSISFAFYNIENLFDTIDDSNVIDESYLPTSKVAWNTERFNHKLNNMAKVMQNIDSTGFPALFGICEVENLGVVENLIAHSDLRPANYKIIHKDSPDERGIDVALLYMPDVYKPIKNTFIKPYFPKHPDLKTRDILYSKGLIYNRDTIHLFINHWVSRWGGQEESEPNRMRIAEIIKGISDSILEQNNKANIIIAGDLNDNPTDKSIYHVLQAREITQSLSEKGLYNLSTEEYKKGNGSLFYKSWDMFDQIIVSASLLKGNNRLKLTSPKQVVYKKDWMLYQPREGSPRPSRTSSGKSYYGGFSDHLPVMVDIEVLN
jgi:endonuclease/exonuclease/phosphatase family protein